MLKRPRIQLSCSRRWTGLSVAALLLAGPAVGAAAEAHVPQARVATVDVFAPARGNRAGIGGRGWFVDLAVLFRVPLARTGFSAFQLTGPEGHNNVPPFAGSFSIGADERLPGLVVLLDTTRVGAGACQNLANLFNLTGVTHLDDHTTELWDTWFVSAPNFGVDTPSTLYAAVAADLNGDGIYNDAPAVVADHNNDGRCDRADLQALGVASNIREVPFIINP